MKQLRKSGSAGYYTDESPRESRSTPIFHQIADLNEMVVFEIAKIFYSFLGIR